MTPASIIHGAQADGVRLALGPLGAIKLAGDRVAVERWTPIILASKAGIVEALAARTVEPLGAEDETAVRAWLAHINETDPATIADVLERCQRDARARAYCLELARDIPDPVAPRAVRCGDCAHFQRTRHPNLGHCAKGEPEAPAGLVDSDRRWCAAFSPLGSVA